MELMDRVLVAAGLVVGTAMVYHSCHLSTRGLEPAPIECATPVCPLPVVEDLVMDADPVNFAGRFVGRLSETAENPVELRDILGRVYAESQWNPAAVSPKGAVGLCGIRLSAWPDVDGDKLISDPVYAADQCLRVYREFVGLCGDDWQCCYLRGVKGCRDWKGEKE